MLGSKPGWCPVPDESPHERHFDDYPEEAIEDWHGSGICSSTEVRNWSRRAGRPVRWPGFHSTRVSGLPKRNDGILRCAASRLLGMSESAARSETLLLNSSSRVAAGPWSGDIFPRCRVRRSVVERFLSSLRSAKTGRGNGWSQNHPTHFVIRHRHRRNPSRFPDPSAPYCRHADGPTAELNFLPKICPIFLPTDDPFPSPRRTPPG